jgi:hypothetical protein
MHSAFELLAKSEDDSIRVKLLSDIRDVFLKRQADKLSSEALVEELKKLEGRPWAEFGKRAKPITTNMLARLLKDFGVRWYRHRPRHTQWLHVGAVQRRFLTTLVATSMAGMAENEQ